MFSKWSLFEALCLVTVFVCLVVPSGMWAYFCLREGKLLDFPSNFAGWAAAGCAFAVGIASAPQFASAWTKAPPTPPPA